MVKTVIRQNRVHTRMDREDLKRSILSSPSMVFVGPQTLSMSCSQVIQTLVADHVYSSWPVTNMAAL